MLSFMLRANGKDESRPLIPRSDASQPILSGTAALFGIRCKGPDKRGHIVADTLLPMMFFGLCKLGNICCGHKMYLNKIRNMLCVPDTNFVCATNVVRAGKREKFVSALSATMCPPSFTRALSR